MGKVIYRILGIMLLIAVFLCGYLTGIRQDALVTLAEVTAQAVDWDGVRAQAEQALEGGAVEQALRWVLQWVQKLQN